MNREDWFILGGIVVAFVLLGIGIDAGRPDIGLVVALPWLFIHKLLHAAIWR